MKQNVKAEVAPAECGQHTPTPWYAGEPFIVSTPESFKGREFIGLGTGAEHLGYISITACVRMAEAKANAAYIVRAANAHDQLVSALQACEEYISLLARTSGDGNDTWATGTIAGDAQAKARAALAQAQK